MVTLEELDKRLNKIEKERQNPDGLLVDPVMPREDPSKYVKEDD